MARVQYDGASPEPYQGLANLRITQGRAEEAKAALRTAMQHTLTRVEAARREDMGVFTAQQGEPSFHCRNYPCHHPFIASAAIFGWD